MPKLFEHLYQAGWNCEVQKCDDQQLLIWKDGLVEVLVQLSHLATVLRVPFFGMLVPLVPNESEHFGTDDSKVPYLHFFVDHVEGDTVFLVPAQVCVKKSEELVSALSLDETPTLNLLLVILVDPPIQSINHAVHLFHYSCTELVVQELSRCTLIWVRHVLLKMLVGLPDLLISITVVDLETRGNHHRHWIHVLEHAVAVFTMRYVALIN